MPADLGYYDLRVPQTREQQAAMAQEAGIDGFCYWHYWFAGRRLLERVFEEVVNSGKPDFPFCLCWANHSWKAKTWDPAVPDKMLMEQTYPGAADYKAQFYAMLPAFKDKRYIRHNGKLLYGIFEPGDIPDMQEMSELWNALAAENGLPGFCFFGFAQGSGALGKARRPGIDIVVYDAMYDAVYVHLHDKAKLLRAKLNSILHRPNPIPYTCYSRVATEKFRQFPETVPCIDPDFDHSPRSGGKGVIMYGSTPRLWGELCSRTRKLAEGGKQDGLMFIKAWNEWGEGNYLEPDLRYGRGYLDETAKALK